MIEKTVLGSVPMRRDIPLHIHLPENYYESDERYPVLYMFDGHNLFRDEDATFGTSWGLEEFFEDFPKDVIIVGLECDHRGTNRLQEYTPYACQETFFGPSTGIGKDLFDWMVYSLKPWIDENYRTWPHREATAIGGSSMGGLMAAYGVINHNDTFSKAACISPSLIFCKDEYTNDLNTKPIDPDTRIYYSFGELELPEAIRKTSLENLQEIKDFLETQKGAKVKIRVQENGSHNEQSWRGLNRQWMDFLWRDIDK